MTCECHGVEKCPAAHQPRLDECPESDSWYEAKMVHKCGCGCKEPMTGPSQYDEQPAKVKP